MNRKGLRRKKGNEGKCVSAGRTISAEGASRAKATWQDSGSPIGGTETRLARLGRD